MKDNQINIKNISKHKTVLWMYSNMIFRVHKEIKIMFGKKRAYSKHHLIMVLY